MSTISVRTLSNTTQKYFNDVKNLVVLPSEISIKKNYKTKKEKYKEIEDVFYAAFSYLRMNSPAAMGELERQTGEYKLFRSLSMFFILDIILIIVDSICNIPFVAFSNDRLVLSFLLLGLTFYRFDFLFDWTHRLAFDFFLQMQKTKTADKNGN